MHPQTTEQRRATILALLVWAGLIAGSHLVARALHAYFDIRVRVSLPPIMGHVTPGVSVWTPLAVAVGIAGVVWGPVLAQRLGWRTLVWASAAGCAAWAVAVALVDGPRALTDPLRHGADYLRSLPLAQELGPREFVATFTERIGDYTTHVRGHPPGFLLMQWGLDALGANVAAWAAGIVIAGGGAGVAAVLVAVRDVAGEARARAAAPFLVLAPAVIWIATSANGLYLGVSAWGVALLVLATGRRDVRGDALALSGGVLCGMALHLTYGAAPLGAIVLIVAAARRRVRPVIVGAVGVVAVALVSGAFGFWWWEGLAATREQYFMGLGAVRPYAYWIFANLAAFGLTLGPAVAPALVRLRDRGLRLLVGAGVVTVLGANFSGMSKAEVERIWLLFFPWVLAAAASLVLRNGKTIDVRAARMWLGAQVAAVLALEIIIHTPW